MDFLIFVAVVGLCIVTDQAARRIEVFLEQIAKVAKVAKNELKKVDYEK